MKKVLLLFGLMILANPAFAGTKVLVQSLDNFSTVSPKYQMSVKVVETHKFRSGFTLEKGSVIKSTVVKVTDPKRGKRNAYIVLRPSTYTVPSKGNQVRYLKNGRLEAKVYKSKKLNKKEAAEKGAVGVGGLMLPGLSQLYYFGKGYSHPQKGKSRLASGGRSVYENSPLSYVEKGKEMQIRRGEYLKLKFYDAQKPKWQIFKRL